MCECVSETQTPPTSDIEDLFCFLMLHRLTFTVWALSIFPSFFSFFFYFFFLLPVEVTWVEKERGNGERE